MSPDTVTSDTLPFVNSAHRYADLSARIILPFFRQEIEISNKSDKNFDPVTTADRSAEEEIRRAITEDWPYHGILGEEFGVKEGTEDYQWILDPIDGTSSFITGLPVWGTLIGLQQGNRPVVGMMNQPFTEDRFWSDGKFTRYRGRTGEHIISTRNCLSIDQAVLSTTSPELFDPGMEIDTFGKLRDAVRFTRYGMDCYAYCLLAAGHIDLVLEAGLKTHDIAPLIPVVEAAGGSVTSWQGGQVSTDGRVLASGNARLHDRVLKLLNV